MNDEIKEILDDLLFTTTLPNVSIKLNKEKLNQLKDYITNLQHTEDLYNQSLKEKIKYVSDKLVGHINAPYVITNEYFEDIIRTIEENTDIQIGTNCMDFMEELEDYKSRCEKAVEIAKDLKQFVYDELVDRNVSGATEIHSKIIDLLNILNGRSE